MIKIFDANDKDFNSNGNIVINPLKCLETKKKSLNGWYIEVEIPIAYKKYIEKDKLCVIKTKSKLNPQAFRISDDITYSTKKISFTANHVMFDSKNYFLLDVRPTNMNALNALKYINERTDNSSPFTILNSNVNNICTNYFVRKNLLEAWIIIEESYNGVFDADNFNISFYDDIGKDSEEIICYGKNLQNMKIFEDWSNVCTKICPVGKDGLLLPENFLVSNVSYSQPYTKTKTFETKLDDDLQTEENLINELRANAVNYLEKNKLPLVSYEISADINQNLEIGDKIPVRHPLVNIFTEVQEYEYDVISRKVKKLIFGNYTRDVKAKFDNIKENIEKVKNDVTGQKLLIQQQTDLINLLNKKGHIYIDDNELLILDALPKENAKNVWRLGLGGFGFSSNGYNGPFETAITMDGKINANFILAGQMSTSRIEGLDELLLSVNKMVNLVQKKENTNYLMIDNAMQGRLQELIIEGPVGLLYPDDDLYPSDDLYPLDSYLIVDKAKSLTSSAKKIHLPVLDLKENEKLVLKPNDCYIVRQDNSIEPLDDIDIELFDGVNYIYLESFQDDNIKLSAKYIVQNQYTDVFANKVEMSNIINQTNERTAIELSKKVGNEEIIARINMSTEKDNDGSFLGIEADKLNLKGKEFNLTTDDISIKSDNFSVDRDGNMRCINSYMQNANIINGNVKLVGANKDDGKVEVSYGSLKAVIAAGSFFFFDGEKYKTILGGGSLQFSGNNSYGLTLTNDYFAFIKPNGGAGITMDGTTDEIRCGTLTQTSSYSKKKNFELYKSALDEIKKIDIYKYNLKHENNNSKKHLGFVIGDNFNYSQMVTNNDNTGVDMYSFTSLCVQAVKEQQVEIGQLKNEINELKEMIKNGL